MSTVSPQVPDPPQDQPFAVFLKAERHRVGIGAERLSRALDVSYSTYRNWERGTNEPSFRDFLKLCLYFGWPHPLRADLPKPPYRSGKVKRPRSAPLQAPLVVGLPAGARSVDTR